jgi:hypothetical protein
MFLPGAAPDFENQINRSQPSIYDPTDYIHLEFELKILKIQEKWKIFSIISVPFF